MTFAHFFYGEIGRGGGGNKYLIGGRDLQLVEDRQVNHSHRQGYEGVGDNDEPQLSAVYVHFSWQSKHRNARDVAAK